MNLIKGMTMDVSSPTLLAVGSGCTDCISCVPHLVLEWYIFQIENNNTQHS